MLSRDKELSREVFHIAWPMIISELGDSLYSIADTYFVSKLGETPLAAVGVGSYLSWLFFVIVALFSTGVIVYVSQAFGAKKLDEARRAIGSALLIGPLVASGVVAGVYLFMPGLVSLIAGNNPELIALTVSYFSIRILALPALTAEVSMDGAVRAVGATKYSMIAVLTSATLNMVLDPIMIFGLFGFPALGVSGAALATLLSILYTLPLELYFLHRLDLLPRFSKIMPHIKKVTRIGLPTAVERFIFSLGNNAYIAFIARAGTAALAAHQIGIRIESFIYMPGFAFAVAASALVGQRIGAGDVKGGKKVGLEAAKLGTALMGVLGIIVVFVAPYLVAPFAPDPKVGDLARIYLILAGLSEPGLALAMILSGGIRGGGRTIIPMVINGMALYTLRVIPAAFLVGIYGAVGAWSAMFIDVWVRGAIFLFIFRKYFEKLARRVVK